MPSSRVGDDSVLQSALSVHTSSRLLVVHGITLTLVLDSDMVLESPTINQVQVIKIVRSHDTCPDSRTAEILDWEVCLGA